MKLLSDNFGKTLGLYIFLCLLFLSGIVTYSLVSWWLLTNKLAEIHSGMNEKEVIAKLGRPDFATEMREDGTKMLSYTHDHFIGLGFDCAEVWFNGDVVSSTREYTDE